MKHYRCKERFALDRYADDGGFVPGMPMIIEEGMEFTHDPHDYLFIARPPAVHLEAVHDDLWIEIHPDTMALHFEEVAPCKS